jgi:hypothetical protein
MKITILEHEEYLTQDLNELVRRKHRMKISILVEYIECKYCKHIRRIVANVNWT